MTIQLYNHGIEPEHLPSYAHDGDAGADVYSPQSFDLYPDETITVGLKFGVALPKGFVAFIFPRSSMCKAGVNCYLPPTDPGYTGEIHAVLHNSSRGVFHVNEGDRIGQLLILPAITPVYKLGFCDSTRGDGAFGSTGK